MVEIIFGFVLLVAGADILVRGASGFAGRLGIPSWIAGLTIVAYGTSLPELVIGVKSAVDGLPALTLGSIIGSNIFNILLVLGITGVIGGVPAIVASVWKNLGLLSLVSLFFAFALLNGKLELTEAIILLLVIFPYTFYLLYQAMHRRQLETAQPMTENVAHPHSLGLYAVFIIGGLLLLPSGAEVLINGAVDQARHWEVSEAVIALSVLSIGSSLPELVTAIVALVHRQNSMALGDILGGNLFNITAIGGLAALFAPVSIEFANIETSLYVMLCSLLLLGVLLLIFRRIPRVAGGLMILSYLCYMLWLYQSL